MNPDVLASIFPHTRRTRIEAVAEIIDEFFETYEINTRDRKTMFLAQVGHESAGFSAMIENLNYSAQSLLRVFPKYFNVSSANSYARKPEAIANRVYANRLGNGPEGSGDGWKHRGRGFIQVTGKSNYMELADYLEMPYDELFGYLETIEGALESAGWYWDTRSLNSFADQNDIVGATKRINGGTNGLGDRREIWARAKKFLP